jgi:ATP-dependent helicase HepA
LNDPAFPVPLLREENLTATFDRNTAIHHEDIEFLTWDHPMVTGAMELILGSEKGNSSAALWPETGEQEILLQAIFVLECVAPPALHADRFLPPTPVCMVVNHLLTDKSDAFTYDEINRHIKGISSDVLLSNPMIKAKLPVMIDRCQEYAQNHAPELVHAGLKEMNFALNGEIQRLLSLKKINPNVREEEIELLQNEKNTLEDAIRSARLRLDALRLIVKM